MGKKRTPEQCMYCGKTALMTREHIFRASWRDKIETNEHLTNLPGVDRKYITYGPDNSKITSKSEDLFSVTLRRVCDDCNNRWMNQLDSVVERWALDPNNDDNRCDPKEFRRWAIKIALLREAYDNLFIVDSADPPKIFAGEDIPEWHVYIGHTAVPEHRHAMCGIGPVLLGPPGGKPFGITQVSWTLGHSLVTALRIHGTDMISGNCYRNFRQYNRVRGGVVREVKPTDSEMPTVRLVKALSANEIQELVWLYTPHPSSPFADEVRKANEGARTLADQLGVEWRDSV
ncbi:MAG: hypothetical protein VX424_08655 [Actinomycetota bacterium]|nr:hypothetical protein [Actinomycetota bacterium]